MSEIEYEIIEIKIPKALLPVINIIGELRGIDKENLLNDLLLHDFESLYETPAYILEQGVDLTKSSFFKDFKVGLEQWEDLNHK